MTWVKLDDGFADHPKITALSTRAFRAHIEALCWCARNLTDGVMGRRHARRLAGDAPTLRQLIDVGVWDEVENDEIQIHDYLEYQPRGEDIRSERAHKKTKKALAADPKLRKLVRERDGDNCRYCGNRVNWSDRRGAMGGTYDHVAPRGDNSIDNLVVACRSCNSRKGGRTPEAAKMPLLPLTELHVINGGIA